MPSIYLLGSQKNEIAREMSKRGLSPKEFAWTLRESDASYEKVEVLVHRPTKFYFVFDTDGDSTRVSIYSPGTDRVVEEGGLVNAWNLQRNDVLKWLDNVKREIQAPDPWSATFRGAITTTDRQWEVEDAPFTDADRQLISSTLRQLRADLFNTYRLSDEDKQLIRARLDYLEEAMTREGKKDWIHTAIGVAVTIGFSFVTTPQLAKDVLAVISKLAQGLFGGGFPQLTP